uniref:T9SS type A sorting domain-containing protein n=1 Tax=Flavobacterium sp. TaxID=239 RepID=UPI00374FF24D
PDFRTSFGTGFAGQSALTGYPSATVNRNVFSGYSMTTGGTAMGRNYWTSAANQILAQTSYVNVAVESNINVNTRLLTVHVEAYYTANSPVASNKLNVALLQNNTLGPQTGGNMGENYNHQHRLVNMLTGQWGEVITTTTLGTFVDRTYTYTIPQDYNFISAELGDFELVAFVTETQQKIISGNGSTPVYLGLPASDAKVKEVNPISAQCKNSLSPVITIQNSGQSSLTNLAINYSINSGSPQVYNWSGNLQSLAKATVTLPNITYTILPTNTLNISLPTDAVLANNTGSITFDKSLESTNTLSLNFQTDAYGDEVSWNIINSAGTSVASGGPYANSASIIVPVTLPADDCYSFNLIDAYGDGGGPVTVTDSNNLEVYYTDGAYGTGESKNFASGSFLNTSVFSEIKFSLYPNPSNGLLSLNTPESLNIVITDITGKIVFERNDVKNNESINLTNLQKGIYIAKLKGENTENVQKLILN